MLKTKHIVLIFIPSILIVFLFFLIKYNQSQALFSKKTGNDKSVETNLDFVPIYEDDPIIGKRIAGNTIITFSDLGCDPCRDHLNVYLELTEKYPNRVKVIWKGLPVTRFPVSSVSAHAYALCANRQNKFSEFLEEILLSGQNIGENSLISMADNAGLEKNQLPACLSSEFASSYRAKIESLALNLGINAVPVTFVNGERLIGAPETIEGWENLLNLK